MKKRLVLIVAVALVVVSSLAMLIGCTPSKPDKYMQKWIDSKAKSVTMVTNEYKYVKEVDKKTGEIKQVKGNTTEEQTIIINENIVMMKVIEISKKINEKTGKEEKTSNIKPTEAIIFEWNAKDNKYNVYTYGLTIKQVEVSGGEKEYVEQGSWTATQLDKETAEKDDYYLWIKEVEDSYNKLCKDIIKDFDNNFKKNKGVYEGKITEEIGSKPITYDMKLKVKDGDLVVESTEGNETATITFNCKEKITLSSGAKESLVAYHETYEGKFISSTTDGKTTTYTIKVDGKDYTFNSKVIGSEILKDAKADDVVKVRITKGKVKEVYSIK